MEQLKKNLEGAGDNASGTACLLEMARLLKEELPDWTFDFAGKA